MIIDINHPKKKLPMSRTLCCSCIVGMINVISFDWREDTKLNMDKDLKKVSKQQICRTMVQRKRIHDTFGSYLHIMPSVSPKDWHINPFETIMDFYHLLRDKCMHSHKTRYKIAWRSPFPLWNFYQV